MKIIGHQKITSLLDRAIARKSISHAYLFSGPESVGKFTVALNFSRKLAGDDAGINPDLIVIRPEEDDKDIKIEAVRELQRKLGLSSQFGGYKVAIIDNADRMNKTAQNAMLKTLEEAGKNVVVILVAQDEKKMLPTILSRCQKIKFGLVSEEDLARNLEEKDKEEIIFWSLGRPGLMLNLKENKEELELRKEIFQELEKLFSADLETKFILAENMAKDINLAFKKMGLWTVILRKFIMDGGSGRKIEPQKALKLIDRIGESLGTMKNTNSNARLVLENLLLEF